MNAALWGALAALAFGVADFIGRFTGRALGPRNAMLGLMLVGAVLLSLHGAVAGMPMVWDAGTLPMLLVAAVAAALGPLALYVSLTLGPISLVAPVCAAYPALVVPVEVMLGAQPGAVAWAAMAVTLAGAVVVARTAGEDPDARIAADPRNRNRAIAAAALSGVFFAVALLAGRQAVAAYGEVQTLWFGRVIGVVCIAALMAAARQPPSVPVRWWPLILLQGIVDAAGYLFFYIGSTGDGGPVAAVAMSAFMVVGVLLGWIVLRERIGAACWCGIGLVFAGVAALSASA